MSGRLFFVHHTDRSAVIDVKERFHQLLGKGVPAGAGGEMAIFQQLCTALVVARFEL